MSLHIQCEHGIRFWNTYKHSHNKTMLKLLLV